MDKLLNEFTVNRPIDEAWDVLTDLERIAPCMPGAQLQEVEGDEYRGVVKVKLGAITTAFKGQATFTERDDAAYRAVLKGQGRDTGGKGNADALITASLTAVSAQVTKCTVETDLRVTGKVAQFGRGIMADVSKKLMTQFAVNLNQMLAEQTSDPGSVPADGATPPKTRSAATPAATTPGSATPDAATPGSAPPATTTPAASAPVSAATTAASAITGSPDAGSTAASAPNATATATPSIRKIEGPAAEPIELSGVAGSAILKRLLPAVAGLVVLLFAWRRLRK